MAYQDYKSVGLDIMVVIGENTAGLQPSLSFCKSYAKSMNLPADKVFIDWGNTYGGWEVMFSKVNPYLGAGGELSLPWDAVLDGDNMEYMSCSMNLGGFGSLVDALNAALAD